MPDEDLTRVIARRLGVPAPDEDLLAAIDDAIEDAEADVVGYLGRPITPQQYTAHGLWPNPFTGWALPETPVLSIVSTTAERWPEDNSLTGTFTVVYTAGLDYRNDPALSPIRRYVRAAAQNAPTLVDYLVATGRRGPISSVSVSTDGQSKSITYSQQTNTGGGGGQAGSDSPGALPSKTSLDKWRLANRRIHQNRTPR